MREKFMHSALDLAKKAAENGEIPVGAVVVKNGEIIGSGYNLTETEKNPFAHAEIKAIAAAAELLGDWRLSDCEIYVTLKPCEMCMGAIKNARIKTLVFGAERNSDPLNPNTFGGVLESKCEALLNDFFKKKRGNA